VPRQGQFNDPDENIRAYTTLGHDWPFNSAGGSYDPRAARSAGVG
jgi:hypothetical protein